METKLERAIKTKIKLGCENRRAALIDIAKSVDKMGMWDFAFMFRVLNSERSCEEFSLEFMTAYNNEIGFRY